MQLSCLCGGGTCARTHPPPSAGVVSVLGTGADAGTGAASRALGGRTAATSSASSASVSQADHCALGERVVAVARHAVRLGNARELAWHGLARYWIPRPCTLALADPIATRHAFVHKASTGTTPPNMTFGGLVRARFPSHCRPVGTQRCSVQGARRTPHENGGGVGVGQRTGHSAPFRDRFARIERVASNMDLCPKRQLSARGVKRREMHRRQVRRRTRLLRARR